MDLRLDIERRKKYLSGEINGKQEGAGESGECHEIVAERSTENASKHHKKSKKSKKKRERSDSSSSSSSCLSHDEEAESMEEGFSQAQLQLRDCTGSMGRGSAHGGFQFRIRGRGWNRMNYLANNINGNSKAYVPVQPKDEEWDPEDMPKNKKYYLQNKKDGEADRKWEESRGHVQNSVPRVKGRFILRRPTSSITTNNPGSNWSYAKFQASGEDGKQPGNNTQQNHKEQNHS